MLIEKPTYGDLIDLLKKVEGQPDAANLLFMEVRQNYPSIPIGRPNRLLDTVKRIAAPTQSSLHGGAKLSGSPLATYRKRSWEPRIRNTTCSAKGQSVFDNSTAQN